MDYPQVGCYGWIWLSQCAGLRPTIENHRDELSELLPVKLEALCTNQTCVWSRERERGINLVPGLTGVMPPSLAFYTVFPSDLWTRIHSLGIYSNEIQNIGRLKNQELGGNNAICLAPGKFAISSFTVVFLYLKTSRHKVNREIIPLWWQISQSYNWGIVLEAPEGRVGSWWFLFYPSEADSP